MSNASYRSFVLVPILAVGGCSSDTITLSVRDAETGQPVSAHACVDYKIGYEADLFPPNDFCRTVRGGRARFTVRRNYLPVVVVAAQGYVPAMRDVAGERLTVPDPNHYAIDLFRDPPPAVVMTLPNRYRGLVRLGLRMPQDQSPTEPAYPRGRRLVAVELSDPAELDTFSAPPIFQSSHIPHFYARYDDGTDLAVGREVFPDQVALRLAGRFEWEDAVVEYRFVLGTLDDYRAWYRRNRMRQLGGRRGG